MRLPRSLHVVPTYFPAVRYGGPIHSVHGLCRSLVELGGEVHVFTTNVDGAGVSAVDLGTPVDLDGVKVWYFPTGLGRRLYRSPEMRAALERNVASFDVLHLHSVFLWPTTIAAKIARRLGVPYVLAPRGMLVDELIRKKNRVIKSAWIELFDRANIGGADAVHVTSEVERAEVEKLGLSVRSFAIVPNGVDMPATRANQSPRDGARPFVLSLGRVNWKKGIDCLIAAMAHAPDADLVIAGNDEDGETAKLKRLAADLGLADRVRFVGPVYGEAKSNLMRECAIFALASCSENFGNVVLEAMSCSRPVVVTPEVGLAKIVAETGSGIVVDGDPEKFGRAIRKLLQDAELRRTLGAAAFDTARDHFSWPTVAMRMQTVYRQIIGPGAGGRAVVG